MNSADLLGQVILQKYELRRCLAENATAFVYEAFCLPLQSLVALKILPPGDRSDEQLERFRREAMVTSQLRHPYALKIFDRGELESGALWLAMELLPGETLAALLDNEKNLSQERLLEILGPVCEVLAEAHQRGIIHRDLHPGNLMIVPIGNGRHLAKILDFGLAGLTASPKITDPGDISGTPAYMAPEQWLGLSKANEQSDIYSLGVIAYQCLSGVLPVNANSPVAWLKAHRREPPRDLQDAMKGRPLSPSIYDAVMRAISREPEARQSSIQEFLEQLTRATPSVADTTPSLPPALASTQEAPPKPGRVALIFSALALMLSGVAVGLLLREPRQILQSVPSTKESDTTPPPMPEPATKPTPSSAATTAPSVKPKPSPTAKISVKTPEKITPTKMIEPTPTTPKPTSAPAPQEPTPTEIDITEITKNPWKNKKAP